MSSLSYLGSRLAPIRMVLIWSSALICMALASLVALKTLDVGGMAGLSSAAGIQRLISLNSIATTAMTTNSMLSYSQSSAHYVPTSTVITLVGLGILILR
jgi:hypothetical protein